MTPDPASTGSIDKEQLIAMINAYLKDLVAQVPHAATSRLNLEGLLRYQLHLSSPDIQNVLEMRDEVEVA